MLNKIIKYFLDHPLVTILFLLVSIIWGIIVAPFGWKPDFLPSDPVSVDAIPDIGENQQIVFTEWSGRSPQDIEDQISYPLTTYLMGIPGVKTVRSSSIFGYSSIYLIFNEEVEFYWSRSRILEKLNSLPSGALPDGVQPTLGPDATALGQVFWYTLEGRDPDGNPTGGWDLQEVRSIQDYYVRYGLSAVDGVSEVASIGGFVQEYQVDVNPDAMKAYDISLAQVMQAVQKSNRDVGAKTLEVNQAEYFVRGLGYIERVEDLEKAVVAVQDNVPIRIKDVAFVTMGPASRRGALDKGGAEVVGGVVVARYGANPMAVIDWVKTKIEELAPGLPRKTLADGTESQLTIVPFYDRSQLIHETLGTLEEALSLEVLITILVVIVMVFNLRASLLISSLLPIAVLTVFIAMRYFDVQANIVALSGIAIAIGTMVDLGIVLSENMMKHMREAPPAQRLVETIYKAASEVSSAILTAVATTVVSFIPVFTLQGAEGKLFGPLAFTKTFALIAALLVSLLIIPTLARWFFGVHFKSKRGTIVLNALLMVVGVISVLWGLVVSGSLLCLFGGIPFLKEPFKRGFQGRSALGDFFILHARLSIVSVGVVWLLTSYWLPLGPQRSLWVNLFFVTMLVGLTLGGFSVLEWQYQRMLRWCLAHKGVFLILPGFMVLWGVTAWLGFNSVFGGVAKGLGSMSWNVRDTRGWKGMVHTFPGIGKEFMPSLDEGSFLYMPSSMPHSGMAYNLQVVGQLDRLLANIPEVDLVVGKIGRVASALDPAPISMYENIIHYKPEYVVDDKGYPIRFQADKRGYFMTRSGRALSNANASLESLDIKELIADEEGIFFRNWREHIRSPNDIWKEIVAVAQIPGVTSSPKLQPIETRLVMLQTGMRAPMGIKVYGPDLQTIQNFASQLEVILKEVPAVKPEAVFADRMVGKPYLQLDIDRDVIGRYGLSIDDVQQVIEVAIGGKKATTVIQGRERYPVRVRYPRAFRNDAESLGRISVPTPTGAQVPMSQLVDISYAQGPQAIKSENTFLVGHVLFDKVEGISEVTAATDAQHAIEDRVASGVLKVPSGVSYQFSGNYENQVRAEKRLFKIIPLVLLLVFLILYVQFKSIGTSLMIFTGIAIAYSGGFLMLWLYGQSWFADFSVFDTNFRELFQVHPINLSVAVWVGFIALFGIATDDGVLMATYLDQRFEHGVTQTIPALREAVVEASHRRIKPATMTSATTIIALLPIITASGRGSDIMIPMAIPAFGGMIVAAITYFMVPVLYSWRAEHTLKRKRL